MGRRRDIRTASQLPRRGAPGRNAAASASDFDLSKGAGGAAHQRAAAGLQPSELQQGGVNPDKDVRNRVTNTAHADDLLLREDISAVSVKLREEIWLQAPSAPGAHFSMRVADRSRRLARRAQTQPRERETWGVFLAPLALPAVGAAPGSSKTGPLWTVELGFRLSTRKREPQRRSCR